MIHVQNISFDLFVEVGVLLPQSITHSNVVLRNNPVVSSHSQVAALKLGGYTFYKYCCLYCNGQNLCRALSSCEGLEKLMVKS